MNFGSPDSWEPSASCEFVSASKESSVSHHLNAKLPLSNLLTGDGAKYARGHRTLSVNAGSLPPQEQPTTLQKRTLQLTARQAKFMYYCYVLLCQFT